MNRNEKKASEEDFKRHNKLSSEVYFKPLPKHPKPPSKLYILSYVATRELEKIEAEEKKFINISEIKSSSFLNRLKK